MEAHEEILTRILAAIDARWAPCRRSHREHFLARRQYVEHGIPWASGESGDAARKRAQLSVDKLVADGLVQRVQPAKLKTLFVKLTEEGDIQARKLAGVSGLRSALMSARMVAKRVKPQPKLLTERWCSEFELIGDCEADAVSREAWIVESLMLPALVRRHVVSACDSLGRCYYGLSRSGWEWITTKRRYSQDFTPDFDPAAAQFYDRRLLAELSEITTRPPVDRDIGPCPLPCSMEGEPDYGEPIL